MDQRFIHSYCEQYLQYSIDNDAGRGVQLRCVAWATDPKPWVDMGLCAQPQQSRFSFILYPNDSAGHHPFKAATWSRARPGLPPLPAVIAPLSTGPDGSVLTFIQATRVPLLLRLSADVYAALSAQPRPPFPVPAPRPPPPHLPAVASVGALMPFLSLQTTEPTTIITAPSTFNQIFRMVTTTFFALPAPTACMLHLLVLARAPVVVTVHDHTDFLSGLAAPGRVVLDLRAADDLRLADMARLVGAPAAGTLILPPPALPLPDIFTRALIGEPTAESLFALCPQVPSSSPNELVLLESDVATTAVKIAARNDNLVLFTTDFEYDNLVESRGITLCSPSRGGVPSSPALVVAATATEITPSFIRIRRTLFPGVPCLSVVSRDNASTLTATVLRELPLHNLPGNSLPGKKPAQVVEAGVQIEGVLPPRTMFLQAFADSALSRPRPQQVSQQMGGLTVGMPLAPAPARVTQRDSVIYDASRDEELISQLTSGQLHQLKPRHILSTAKHLTERPHVHFVHEIISGTGLLRTLFQHIYTPAHFAALARSLCAEARAHRSAPSLDFLGAEVQIEGLLDALDAFDLLLELFGGLEGDTPRVTLPADLLAELPRLIEMRNNGFIRDDARNVNNVLGRLGRRGQGTPAQLVMDRLAEFLSQESGR